MQDFAGSTVVHLIGATGGARRRCCCSARARASTGLTASRGRSRALDAARRPRGADPVVRLVRLQPRLDARRSIGAASPRCRGDATWRRRPAWSARVDQYYLKRRRSTSAWWATARSPVSWRSPLRRATSSSGLRRDRLRRRCDRGVWRAGIEQVSTTRSARSRRTAWPASGARSRAGSSRLPRLAEYNAVGRGRPLVLGQRSPARQRRRSAWRSRSRSCSSCPTPIFAADQGHDRAAGARRRKRTRLDIVEHGMYGYPEQFIPPPEYGALPPGPRAAPVGAAPQALRHADSNGEVPT